MYANNKYLAKYMEDSGLQYTEENTFSLFDKSPEGKNQANKVYYEYGKKFDFSGGLKITWTHLNATSDILENRITVSQNKDYSNAVVYRVAPKSSESFIIGNLLPDRIYYYKVEEVSKSNVVSKRKSSYFKTQGQERFITVDGVDNVRDLGGWPTSFGLPVRYGLLYRSAQLDAMTISDDHSSYMPTITEQGIYTMREVCGINAELDIRGDGVPASCLGADVDFKSFSQGGEAMPFFAAGMSQKYLLFAEQLQWIIDEMKKGKVVDFHCTFGADRAGSTALLIEGLLGMSTVDIDRDYELTSLYGSHRQRSANYYRAMYDSVRTIPHCAPELSLTQCFYQYWNHIGISTNDLDYFINHMLGYYTPYVRKKILGQVEASSKEKVTEPTGWSIDDITPGDYSGDKKINVGDIIKYQKEKGINQNQ